MADDCSPTFSQRKHVEPIFHPQMKRTRDVIRRPEWVKRSGEGVVHRGSLNSVALFGILFANCIGGGYGFEDGIGAAGPLITLVVCLLIPWIWSLPTGLAVAELSTAVPSNSGVLMWANAAFPPFISFLVIIMTIFITFIGNATYPNLTAEYVEQLHPMNKGQSSGIKIAVVMLCCVLNCVGVEIVGSSSIILCAITILPFSLLTVIRLFGSGFNKAVLFVGKDERGLKGVDWPGFFSIISWNYANIENAGAVVEEIANPRKTLPRAMLYLMFGTYVGYVMPMLAGVSAVGVGQDYTKWSAGHWPEVAQLIAGDWLKYMLFAGAMLSGVGFTLTNMCCTSRLLAGMGTMQMFPKKISRIIGYYHPRLGTPIPAILLNSAVTIIFSCTLNFGDVVSLCQSLYCMRLLVIYAAVIKLRIQYPDLARPYALPCNTWVAALCLAPAAAFSLMAAIFSAMVSLPIGMAFLGFMVGGCALSWLYCRVFARNGFQGVIVQCEISDDDDGDGGAAGGGGDGDGGNNNASGAGGEACDALHEGIFYHDGEDEDGVHNDMLLGILPVGTAAAANANATVISGSSIALGTLGDGSITGINAGTDGDDSDTSGEDVAAAHHVAQEENASIAFDGSRGGGGLRQRRRGNKSSGRREGGDHNSDDDEIDIPLHVMKGGVPGVLPPPPREPYTSTGHSLGGGTDTDASEGVIADDDIIVPLGRRRDGGGGSRRAARGGSRDTTTTTSYATATANQSTTSVSFNTAAAAAAKSGKDGATTTGTVEDDSRGASPKREE